jgi:TfoX/Sxy family transcriptional regulator of competence genes
MSDDSFRLYVEDQLQGLDGLRFRPSAKHTLVTYDEVPADVLDDRDELAAWAERARQVGAAATRTTR